MRVPRHGGVLSMAEVRVLVPAGTVPNSVAQKAPLPDGWWPSARLARAAKHLGLLGSTRSSPAVRTSRSSVCRPRRRRDRRRAALETAHLSLKPVAGEPLLRWSAPTVPRSASPARSAAGPHRGALHAPCPEREGGQRTTCRRRGVASRPPLRRVQTRPTPPPRPEDHCEAAGIAER